MKVKQKKAIIIVSAGTMQIPAIKIAKEMGLIVIATDLNPNAPGFKYCDHSSIIDSKDAEGHVRYALKNAKELNIQGAFSASDCAVTVSAITNALGLPGIPQEVAKISNNKALMKERWIRDKIPTPFGSEVTTINEAKLILKHTGFPAMIKAVDNAASRGSMKINSLDQLDNAIANAKEASITSTAIVEEYITGSEQSVETIIWNGRHYHVGMADRVFGYHPYHIETAHIDPSILNNAKQKLIYETVDAAADSLGINFGPAKADMIWTSKGPMILEMPARLSGGFHSQYTTPLSSGQNPIRAVMELALGCDLDETLIQVTKPLTSICAGIFPPKGILKAIHGVKEAYEIEGVEKIIINKKVGDFIEDYVDNGFRFCWVIAVGKSKKHAYEVVELAKNTIKFEVY
jgi:biotin carboxylase